VSIGPTRRRTPAWSKAVGKNWQHIFDLLHVPGSTARTTIALLDPLPISRSLLPWHLLNLRRK
jgi:hypothetical protein